MYHIGLCKAFIILTTTPRRDSAVHAASDPNRNGEINIDSGGVIMMHRIFIIVAAVALPLSLAVGLTAQPALAQGPSTAAVTPASGRAGSTVTGSGANWTPGDHIQAYWADNNSTLGNPVVVASDGTFKDTGLTIPSGATAGSHQILFSDEESRYFVAASFNVMTLPVPTITTVGTYTKGVLVYFDIHYADPGKDAEGFGFVGVNGSGWAEENHPFSSPSYGIVGPDSIAYPFNEACGTPQQYDSYVQAWIYDTAGDRSTPVVIHLVCTTTPTGNGTSSLQLPYPPGTKVSIGPKGLHGENFRSILDDRTKKVYTLSNNTAPDSLDIVLQPAATGTATVPTTPLRAGVVLAVWKACQVVLIDHGGGLWGIYLHQAGIAVQSGQTVTGDTTLGYSTTAPPSGGATCGNVSSDAEHVHIALLNGGSGQTGSYESLLGVSLCGHKVVRLNQDNTQIILQGLTTTPGQQFSVPC